MEDRDALHKGSLTLPPLRSNQLGKRDRSTTSHYIDKDAEESGHGTDLVHRPGDRREIQPSKADTSSSRLKTSAPLLPTNAGDATKMIDKITIEARRKSTSLLGKSETGKEHLHSSREKGEGKNSSWLMRAIARIVATTSAPMKVHKCKFVNNESAARHNARWLKHYKWDFVRAIEKHKRTILDPGSEFRDEQSLEPLWAKHAHWPKMRQIISHGVDYPLDDISEEEQTADLEFMINRGNHKSAMEPESASKLFDNYTAEVERGWMLPLPVKCLKKLTGAAVIPVGVHTQFTVDGEGKRAVKRRTTHDASFPPPSTKSVNNRLIRELLTDCFYGHCMMRILHGIHIMRLNQPFIRILMLKLDLDAAYRRLHVTARMALLTITVIQKIAYILLRLPFGVANGPNDYSLISEPIFDLTNDVLRDPTFDPTDLHSPLQSEFEAPASTYDDSTPFEPARPLFVDVPFFWAMADGYIDDIITIVLDVGGWLKKAVNAAPLVIHSMFRPTDAADLLPRNEPISIRKLKGEGTPDEVKVILGWQVDTRRFRIHLPFEKSNEWIADIKVILSNTTISAKTLESTIGRLNHAGYIIPQGRYFLNRLRHLLSRCKKMGPQKIPESAREDLHLWMKILHHVSHRGVNINNITFTEPTEICISDACEQGIGGYNMSGLAWRYKLPPYMVGILSINLLEFLAAAITIKLTLDSNENPQKILSFTDSSSALGWLYKASFAESMPVHNHVARWLATQLMEHDSALYSQHIRGLENFIADSLSRDHHLTTQQLTFAFRTLLPSQMPTNFVISTLPRELVSWICSLSALSIKNPESLPAPSVSKLGALIGGGDSLASMALKMNGCQITTSPNAPISSQPLQRLAEEIYMARQKSLTSEGLQLKLPSHMYARPFGRIYGQIPP